VDCELMFLKYREVVEEEYGEIYTKRGRFGDEK
jgi:hypothetical protein